MHTYASPVTNEKLILMGFDSDTPYVLFIRIKRLKVIKFQDSLFGLYLEKRKSWDIPAFFLLVSLLKVWAAKKI